jgi:hypothetical protein
MINCRLMIWINKKPVLQGKIYKLDKKWVFLVNVDKNKIWRNFNGYSIANQILELFEKAKLRPLILYKNVENGLVFMANQSMFKKFGIQVNFGSHRQIVLPVNKWKFFKEELKEPFNLPQMTTSDWLNQGNEPKDIQIDLDVRRRLREEFNQKYA